jgi:Domain of unknown function (DUF4314)
MMTNDIKLGSRIRLLHTDNKYTSLRSGDQGKVTSITQTPEGRNQIWIDWDKYNSRLVLIEGIDDYEVID